MNSVPGKYHSQSKSLLILGYGDLGERLAEQLAPDNWQIRGLCRTTKRSAFAELHQGDAGEETNLRALLAQAPDQILVTLTPGQRTRDAYRATYLRSMTMLVRACHKMALKPHVIFVSSTAVYGQDDGSVVDEKSVAETRQFNGRILRQTEKHLQTSDLPLTILRFSGIYGRRPASLDERLRGALPSFRPYHWTNRIHVRDAVRVMQFVLSHYALRRDALGILLGSDLCPVQEGELENWLREQLNLPPLTYVSSSIVSGKECSSSRLQRLGYRFLVDDFRAGYLAGR